MQVTQELREFWNKNKERKDINTLAEKTGLHRITVSRLLNGVYTETNSKTVQKFNLFFKNKEKQIQKAQLIDID